MSDSATFKKVFKQKRAERYRRSVSITKHWTQKNVNQLIKDAATHLKLSSKSVSAIRTAYKISTKSEKGDLIRNLVTAAYTQRKAERSASSFEKRTGLAYKMAEEGVAARLNYSKLLVNWADEINPVFKGDKPTIAGLRYSLRRRLHEYTPTGVTYSSAWNEKVAKEVGKYIKKHGKGPRGKALEAIEHKATKHARKAVIAQKYKRAKYDNRLGDSISSLFDDSPKGADEKGSNYDIYKKKREFSDEEKLKKYLLEEQNLSDYY